MSKMLKLEKVTAELRNPFARRMLTQDSK